MLPAFIYAPENNGTYKRPNYRVQGAYDDFSTRIEPGEWVVLERGDMFVYTDEEFHRTFEVIE